MIKTIGGFEQTLATQNSDGWVSRVGSEIQQPFEQFKVPTESGETKTFGEFLAQSLAEVNKLQDHANVEMQKLASGESKDLHETLLAVEKAEIAFKTMNQIRGKVIEAYKEVMRMQV
jgi:flagellar hook-basal body complex protein FliE